MHVEVGDYVYRAFQPQKPGKVARIAQERPYFNLVEIKWISGETTVTDEGGLRDFNGLIADHEKKLQTHKSKLPKLGLL